MKCFFFSILFLAGVHSLVVPSLAPAADFKCISISQNDSRFESLPRQSSPAFIRSPSADVLVVVPRDCPPLTGAVGNAVAMKAGEKMVEVMLEHATTKAAVLATYSWAGHALTLYEGSSMAKQLVDHLVCDWARTFERHSLCVRDRTAPVIDHCALPQHERPAMFDAPLDTRPQICHEAK